MEKGGEEGESERAEKGLKIGYANRCEQKWLFYGIERGVNAFNPRFF